MRLAVVRQRYTPFGGAERFIENALEALLERNVAITLYTREWPRTNVQLMEPQIVDPFHIGRLWRDAGFAFAVCRKIKRAQPELVQSHERLLCCDVFRAGDGVHAVWLEERGKGRGAFARLATRASPYHNYVLRKERALFASSSLAAVICNSSMVRDEIKLRFSVADAKLHVVYNAVDSDVFTPALREHRSAVRQHHGIAADALVFLLVGSGYERKGVMAAIDALALLPPHAHLVIVGRESKLRPYIRHARDRAVLSRLTFAGPQQDPKPYYGAADAFVLPTLYDPLPNAALEAMACALPIVTSTKSGVAELVMGAEAGFVCAARDSAALAAQMRTLEDGATRERMGANARKAVLPLSPAAMTLQLVMLYKELLEVSVARRRAAKSRRVPLTPRSAAAAARNASRPSDGDADAS